MSSGFSNDLRLQRGRPRDIKGHRYSRVLSAMAESRCGSFLYFYITVVKEQKVVCSAGNKFIANTIILNVSAKRKCKRIDFKRFVDQAFLVHGS